MDDCQSLLRREAGVVFAKWVNGEIHAADCQLILEGFFCADTVHSVALHNNLERKATANNTGSTKLPDLLDLNVWCHNSNFDFEQAKAVYWWFVRQLRAGA